MIQAGADAAGKRRRSPLILNQGVKDVNRTNNRAVAWIVPALIAMLLVQFLPGFFSIGMSFTDLGVTNLRELSKVNFVGMKNFLNIFKAGKTAGNQFATSLLGTIEYTLICSILGYLLGLGQALLMNQRFKGRGIVRALLLVPWIVPNGSRI